MACYCQRSERAEVAAVLECNQTERDDDQEHSFLVNMPTKEERCVATQSNGADEGLPLGPEPELDQGDLTGISKIDSSREEDVPAGRRK